MYAWVTEPDACEACQELDGYHEEQPDFPHPNCLCNVYEVDMSTRAFKRLQRKDRAEVLTNSPSESANTTMTRDQYDGMSVKEQREAIAQGIKFVD